HIGSDEFGRTECGDNNVGRTAYLFDVGGCTMTYGYRGIARISLLHHECSYRFAHNVASSQYHTMFSFGLSFVASKQLHDSGGCSRYETGQPDGHAPYIDRVKSVDIFPVVDSFDHLLFRDVFGQG